MKRVQDECVKVPTKIHNHTYTHACAAISNTEKYYGEKKKKNNNNHNSVMIVTIIIIFVEKTTHSHAQI